jgi:two-component system cell cycle sensor histidine kinase/response regulator CckA
LTGYSLEEVHGKTPRILKSGEQGPEIYQEMWKAILSGSVFRGILVNRKKNGELYYVEESICPIRDADGKITHFISNGRDLTERLRLEAQLLQAQKMDAIGRLAGGSCTRLQQSADHYHELLRARARFGSAQQPLGEQTSGSLAGRSARC